MSSYQRCRPYAAHDTPGANESAALATTTTPDAEVGAETPPLYGPMKALCEQEAQKGFPGTTTIIRPSLVVGIGDPTDRFTYWPVRIARGGEVLAPPADNPVQIIDARDLSEWVIRCCEQRLFGVFNAGGDGSRFTIGQMLAGTRAGLGSSATFTHVTTAFLTEQKVAQWIDLPVWLPAEGMFAGALLRSIARARAAGLNFRPFADTVKETMAFYQMQTEERKAKLRAGLSAEREAAVLAAWKARTPRL
jgi:2'-hydroxyisoflavone reductase